MKMHLAAYPLGVHRISETVEAQELKLDQAIFRSPLQASIQLDRHDPYLQCVFDLETVAHLECDRCLNDFEFHLRLRSPMLYVMGRTTDAEDVDDPEIAYIPVGTTDLDISNDLRDFLILALPEKRLCRENCRGLCPRCGTDLNFQDCSCGISLSA